LDDSNPNLGDGSEKKREREEKHVKLEGKRFYSLFYYIHHLHIRTTWPFFLDLVGEFYGDFPTVPKAHVANWGREPVSSFN
jgi:hypothetical protein